MEPMLTIGGIAAAAVVLTHAAALTFVFLLRTFSDLHRWGRRHLQETRNECILPVSMITVVRDSRQTRNVEKLLAQRCRQCEIIIVAERGEVEESLIRRYAMVPSRKPIRRVLPCSEQARIYESTGGSCPVRLACGGSDFPERLNLAICAAEYPWILLTGGRLLSGALPALAEPVLTRQGVRLTWNPAVPSCRGGAGLRQQRQCRRALWTQTLRRRPKASDTVLCPKGLLEELGGTDTGTAGEGRTLEEKLAVYMKSHVSACVRVRGTLCRTEQAEAGQRRFPLRLCADLLLWTAEQWGGCPRSICCGLIIMDVIFHGVMGQCVWLAARDFRLNGEKPGNLLRLFLIGALAE